MKARYDGLADWYEERFVTGAETHQPGLLDLLGPGSGPCLDIGCGTGRTFETIRATGRDVDTHDGSRLIHPSYRTPGWARESPWWAEDGIRRRVGMRHIPLAEYLNAFLSTGLVLEQFVEPGGFEVPHALGVRARRG